MSYFPYFLVLYLILSDLQHLQSQENLCEPFGIYRYKYYKKNEVKKIHLVYTWKRVRVILVCNSTGHVNCYDEQEI